MLNVFYIALGLAFLTIGGEALIRGSMAAARRLNVSPLLSGLIIVGFGTSTPELVVSLEAAISQRPDLAIGNVVGSNIGNILLILGTCAVITPMAVRPLALRRDALTVVAASILFVVLASGDQISITDAVIFLSAFFAYLIWAYFSEHDSALPSAEMHAAEADELKLLPRSVVWIVAAVLLGLLLLIAGSRILLSGAVGIAQNLGVSEALIGLTVVAVGTSLPEYTVSLMAAIRKHADVAVGNVLGSNIFNLLGILGVSALLQPLPLHPRVLQFDQWVMLGTSLLLLLFLFTGRRLSRLEGGLLLAGYLLYIGISFITFSN